MSKILFWSPLHGQGQTSNLHVAALIMSLLHKKRVLMMQTHYSGNNLESPLIGENVGKENPVENNLFLDIGLDTAVIYSKMSKLNRNMLENCCFSFPGTRLLLLPGTETKNRDTFERDIGKSVFRMIAEADQCMDLIIIDSNSGEDQLSFKLMQSADLIVINLTQHRYVLERLFREYKDTLLNHNVFYLFGEYDDNAGYNINNCRRKYRKYMNSKNSGVIPYCTEFLDAQNECDVLNFIQQGLRVNQEGELDKLFNHLVRRHQSPRQEEETEYFFHRSRLAVEKMLDLLQLPIKKEHREGDLIEFK